MSLFDFIAVEMSQDKKKDLYTDRNVCLCLFRVAFTALEQHLIYKLAYLDRTYTPKDIAEWLKCPRQDQRQETSREFFKKLVSLEMVTEIKPQQIQQNGQNQQQNLSRLQQPSLAQTSSSLSTLQTPAFNMQHSQISSSMPSSQNMMMNKQTSMPMTNRQKQIQPDAETDFIQRSFTLNDKFKENLINMASENLQLRFIKPISRTSTDFARIEADSFERWSKMIYYMLNIVHDSELQNVHKRLLKSANYLEENQGSGGFCLTASGFQFILMEAPVQVHNILLYYIKQANRQSSAQNDVSTTGSSTNSLNVVEMVQFIFNLTLTEPNQWYKLTSLGSTDTIKQILLDFHHLGLITKKKANDISDSKFCINSLIHSFLLSQNKQQQSDEVNQKLIDQAQASHHHGKQNFIIVETNFKVYAYTDSLLYQAILRLFMREEYRFPNMIAGTLTRESLKEAFRRNITAKQIMNFLEQHAHVTAMQNKQLMRERDLINSGKQMLAGGVNHLAEKKSKSISDIFGLSKDRGLQAVAQQLEIWQKEMKFIQDFKGILIKFDNEGQHQEFKEFKARNPLKVWLWNEEWGKNDNVVVVDIENEKLAYEFINTSKK